MMQKEYVIVRRKRDVVILAAMEIQKWALRMTFVVVNRKL